jgi:hypothetical protein
VTSIRKYVHGDHTYIDYNGLIAWLMQERNASPETNGPVVQKVIDALAWWMISEATP